MMFLLTFDIVLDCNKDQLEYFTDFDCIKKLKFIQNIVFNDGTLSQTERAKKANEIINSISYI